MWYTYILKCSDDSYYVGSTQNLQNRVDRHNTGRASAWTAARTPVKLVYYEQFDDKNQAKQRERQFKKWSRTKKEILIKENQPHRV